MNLRKTTHSAMTYCFILLYFVPYISTVVLWKRADVFFFDCSFLVLCASLVNVRRPMVLKSIASNCLVASLSSMLTNHYG